MAKDKLTEYDATAANNTVVGDVNLAENSALPSDMNNAVRELMSHLKEFADGTNGINVLTLADDDASASIKFQAPSAVTATVTFTLPDGDGADGQALITNGSGTLAWAYPYGNRNLIINGAQIVSQRNGTSSTTPSNFAYLTDRFQFRATQGSKFNAEQSTTAATGFKNSLKMTVASAYTVTSSDQFGIRQFIEGQNISHLEWGTSNAKSVTLSFFVRSSVTGTHSGALGNNGDARAYPFSFTVSSADTWEQKTITIPGDTSGTWLDTNGIGIKVNFNLGAGSNNLATAGAWTTGEKVGATGAVSVVGTASATFYITGVQLEVGSATPFEHRSFGDELQRCQRYYHRLDSANGNGNYLRYNNHRATSTTGSAGTYHLPIKMRVTPSIGTTGTASDYALAQPAGNTTCSITPAISGDGSGPDLVSIDVNVSSGLTAGQAVQLMSNNNKTSFIAFDAEL